MNTKIWDLNAAEKPHAEWACFFPHMAGCQTSSKSHAHHPLASLASTWDACPLMVSMGRRASQCTMRFGSTAKVLAKCKLTAGSQSAVEVGRPRTVESPSPTMGPIPKQLAAQLGTEAYQQIGKRIMLCCITHAVIAVPHAASLLAASAKLRMSTPGCIGDYAKGAGAELAGPEPEGRSCCRNRGPKAAGVHLRSRCAEGGLRPQEAQ